MPGEKFKAGPDVYAMMRDLIGKFHPHLAICDDEIGIIMEEKATKVEGKPVMGKSKKAAEEHGILGDTAFKFIIYLPADEWKLASDAHRQAMVDRQLCLLKAEPDPEDPQAAPKFRVGKYDVTYSRGEFERHGAWLTSGAAPTDNLIEELFGAKEEDITVVAAPPANPAKTKKGKKGVSAVGELNFD